MKISCVFRVPALGLEVPAELEVDAAALNPASNGSPFIDEPLLAQRWHLSRRTVRRRADEGKIPFAEPTAGHRLFRLSDVEAYELGAMVPAARDAARRMARGGK